MSDLLPRNLMDGRQLNAARHFLFIQIFIFQFMKTITLFWLYVIVANSIYEYQAGLHDWSYSFFGQLEEAIITFNQIFYRNSMSEVGSISKKTGQVLYQMPKLKYEKVCQSYKQERKDATAAVRGVRRGAGEGAGVHAEGQLAAGAGVLPAGHAHPGLHAARVRLVRPPHPEGGALGREPGGPRRAVQVLPLLRANEQYLASSLFQGDASVLVKHKQQICVYPLRDHQIAKDHQDHCQKKGSGVPSVQTLDSAYLYWDDSTAILFTHNQFPTQVSGLHYLLSQATTFFPQNNAFATHDSLYLLSNPTTPIMSIDRYMQFANRPVGKVNEDHFCYVRQQNGKLYFQVFDSRLKSDQTIGVVDAHSNAPVSRLFLRVFEQGQKRLIVAQHSDLHTVYFADQKIVWENNQSLHEVEEAYFERFEEEKTQRKNTYHESLDRNGPLNPLYALSNLVLRVTNDVSDLLEWAVHQTSNLDKVKDWLTLKRSHFVDEDTDLEYGLIQKVVLLTKAKTVMCLNTNNGAVLWKHHIAHLDDTYTLQGHFQLELNILHREADDSDDKPLSHLLVYHSPAHERMNIFLVQQHDVQQIASIKCAKLIYAAAIKVHNAKNNNLLLLIDDEHNIVTYPRIPQLQLDNQFVFYQHDQATNQIQGYTLISNVLVQIWNIHLNNQLVAIKGSYHEGHQNPRIALWDDRRVLFKLIDHSNFAVLTKDLENQLLNLYVVNSKTGKIVFQSFQKNVDFEQPINLLFDENTIVVTYFNPSTSIYEIWTIEAYHTRIETSFLKLLDDYYFNQRTETKLNYYEADLQAVFLQQVYGYHLGIKHLSVARTLKSLTKKNLLIITPNNQLHSLDRNMISARRRRKENTQILDYSFESAELPPYDYIVPINYQSVLNYKLKLNEMKNFYLSASNLESTSLLLAAGDDLFFTRISPDKVDLFLLQMHQTYDMIQPDFNYGLLVATVVLVLILSQFMRNLARRSKILKVFNHG